MSSDSVSSFLVFARANRLLSADVVDELLATSHRPHQNLSELCDSLVARGLLSPFQVGRIRAGHTEQLVVAGYPLVDEIGPCPGGTTYRAVHPSLQMMVVGIEGPIARLPQAEKVEQEIIDSLSCGDCIQADDTGIRLTGAVGLSFALLV